MEDNIYNLELHNATKVDNNLIITRVPGGWIYESLTKELNSISSTFVPYNEEFKDNQANLKSQLRKKDNWVRKL